MTADEFWNGEPRLAKSYKDAHKLKTEERNQILWMQGLYNHEAFAVAIDKAFSKHSKAKYPSEPIRVTPLSEDEKNEEKERMVEDFRDKLNSLAKRWQGGDKP